MRRRLDQIPYRVRPMLATPVPAPFHRPGWVYEEKYDGYRNPSESGELVDRRGRGRPVDLPASTVAVLKNVREIRQVEAAVNGTEALWLFPGPTPDMPVTPETVQRSFARVLKAAGIRKIRPHDLRHTYATLAIKAGVPLLTVSRQLGHASIAITADVYTHAVPRSNRAAADALEAIITSNQKQPPRNPPS